MSVRSAVLQASASAERFIKTLGVVAAMAALIAITLLAARSMEGFRERADWVERSHAVRSEIEALRAGYETSRFHWRYYFITGAAESLAQYRHAAKLLTQRAGSVRAMVTDDPAQVQRLQRLERLLVDDHRRLDELAARKEAGAYQRSDAMLEGLERTQPAMASASAIFAEMLAAENELLHARQRESERSERAIKWIVLGGSTAAIAMLAMAFVLLRREITLHRRTQAQAERLTAELEDLHNKAPCGYHSVDENGLIVRMNDTWLGWLGYARDEVVGKLHHHDLMAPESARRFREHWFPLFKKQGWLKEVEFEYVRKDGTTFPGSLQTSTIYGPDGRYVMSRTTVFDISERRRVEDALKDANAFLDSVVENIPNMIFVKDARELRFVRFNRAGEELLGYSRSDLVGKNDYDFFPAAEADFFTAKDREVLHSGSLLEIDAERIDTRLKGTRMLHTRKLPIPGPDGAPKYLLGISEDITERKAAEERIHALNDELQTRAAQLEAVNEELESFSYSVSHDLRAPLRAVDGYARMLEEDYGPRLDEEGRRLLGVVRDSSRRMGELIDDLLAFSRLGRQELAKRPLDMTALAREVISKLAPESHAEVCLAALPAAEADRALLRQVWMNLIGNALKYSGTRAAARIQIGGSEARGENLYWVRDNGVGFDMRYAGKLFGVFQRLHSADEFPGTGVGLAIVQRVVARHGGRVWAEGRPGEGATFHFSLPREPGA